MGLKIRQQPGNEDGVREYAEGSKLEMRIELRNYRSASK